jgi:hypothetical protein
MVLRAGRRSRSVDHSWSPGAGGVRTRVPKEAGPNPKVSRSNFDTSSWSVTTTSAAGAVASGLFSNMIS